MKSRLILLLLAAPATAAFAQYKCTAANGSITFQQTACPSSQTEQKLVVVPNGQPLPASGAASASATKPAPAPAPAAPGGGENVDKRMLAKYERQRERDALERALQGAQADKDGRAASRLQDIAGAKRQFGDDPANAQALREALTAIDNRYKALGDLDDSRIQGARKALADWDSAH